VGSTHAKHGKPDVQPNVKLNVKPVISDILCDYLIKYVKNWCMLFLLVCPTCLAIDCFYTDCDVVMNAYFGFMMYDECAQLHGTVIRRGVAWYNTSLSKLYIFYECSYYSVKSVYLKFHFN